MIEGSLRNRVRQRTFDIIETMPEKLREQYATRVYTPRPKTQDGKVAPKRVREGLQGVVDNEIIENSEFLNRESPLSMERVKEWMKEHGVEESVLEDGLTPGQVEFWRMTKSRPDDDLQVVLRDGKPEYWAVHDDLLMKFFQNFGYNAAREMDGLMKYAFQMPKEVLQAGVTTFPGFLIDNGMRDAAQASVLSKNFDWRNMPFVNTMYGTVGRIVNKKEYAEFKANGGGFMNMRQSESGELGEGLARMYRKWNVNPDNVLNTPAKLMGYLEEAISTVENSARFAEYKSAKKKGKSARGAASASRLVSTDFSARGASANIQRLVAIYPFLNPGIQGIAYAGRQAVQAPLRTGRRALYVAGAAYALREMNKGYDIIEEQPDYKSDTHYMIPVDDNGIPYPGNENATDIMVIPKDYTFGVLAGSLLGERVPEAVESDQTGTEKADDVMYHAVRLIGEHMLLNPVPQTASLAFEQMRNEKFTGAPIVPPQMEGVKATEQWDHTDNYVVREISSAVGLPTKRVEHLLRSGLGSWGGAVLDAVDYSVRNTSENIPDLPSMKAGDVPILNSFIESGIPQVSESEIKFYRLIDNTKMNAKTAQYLNSQQRTDRLEYLMNNHPSFQRAVAMEPGLSKVIDKISEANRAIDGIRKLPDDQITAKERRQQVDRIRKEVQGGVKQLVDRLEEDPWAKRAMERGNMLYDSLYTLFGSTERNNDSTN
jgi:hypothetical protein